MKVTPLSNQYSAVTPSVIKQAFNITAVGSSSKNLQVYKEALWMWLFSLAQKLYIHIVGKPVPRSVLQPCGSYVLPAAVQRARAASLQGLRSQRSLQVRIPLP